MRYRIDNMSYKEYEQRKGKLVYDDEPDEIEGWFDAYMEEVQRLYNENEIPFVVLPCIRDRIEALFSLNIAFTLVIPRKDQKEEYLQRFAERGNPEVFLNFFDANWDTRYDELYDLATSASSTEVIYLEPGEFLSDYILTQTTV